MNTRHKHADVAIAFAEGKKIQNQNSDGDWVDWKLPFFPSFEEKEWRIKPDEPVVRWLWVKKSGEVLPFMATESEAAAAPYKIYKIEGTRTGFPSE